MLCVPSGRIGFVRWSPLDPVVLLRGGPLTSDPTRGWVCLAVPLAREDAGDYRTYVITHEGTIYSALGPIEVDFASGALPAGLTVEGEAP